MRVSGITAYMLLRSPRLGAVALSIVPVVAVVNKYYGDWLGVSHIRFAEQLQLCCTRKTENSHSFQLRKTLLAYKMLSLQPTLLPKRHWRAFG